MNKEEIIEALKKAKESSPKRNFKQSIDLIFNLKGINVKKSDQQISAAIQLHYPTGKKVSVCALVGPELAGKAKESCDEAVLVDDFQKYADKKLAKKLADKHDFFIAQANIMAKIATDFGRVFGPKGKMPNPKFGCVVPPNANLKPLYEKLQKTIIIRTKNDPIIQCMVGKEGMKDEEAADNILTVYNTLLHALPSEKHNINSVYLKLTMGKPAKIGEKAKEKGN